MDFQASYRQEMAYQIYIVAGLLVLPFSVVTMSQGQFWLALPPFISALMSVANVIWYKKNKQFIFSPIAISVIYILDCALVVRGLGPSGAYWLFPVMLAIFWVHDRKMARYLVSAMLLLVFIPAFYYFPLTAAARLSATLIMTAVFFNAAAKIAETQYKKLETLTVTDYLTGAFNRRYMDQEIDELIERYNRNKSPSSIITFDIDNFKMINDKYGHSVGDEVLVEVAKNTKARVRSLDRVCRSGGEEFVILLPDTSENEAKLLGEELRISISELPLLKNSTVTISCGVSAMQSNDSRDSWLKRSDQAMYKAKSNGKNTVVVDCAINFSGEFAEA
ncbi:MAG: GGDEF domain-containing protein [Cellvibrionaceae bacterium]